MRIARLVLVFRIRGSRLVYGDADEPEAAFARIGVGPSGSVGRKRTDEVGLVVGNPRE